VSSPKKKPTALTPALIEQRILIIRGQRVMLDSDLAELYRVTTFRLNEQVSRNRDRFPPDFAYQLTLAEFRALISQNAISKNAGRGGRRKLPWVFTEHGVAMLSSVLRSPTQCEIMRAFIRLRRLLATPGELATQLRQLADTVQLHDDQIRVIAEVLRRMNETPSPPHGRIGFQAQPTREVEDSTD
jgi:ORF6N domain